MAAEGEEGDIDLFNDETFGDGAVGEYFMAVCVHTCHMTCHAILACTYLMQNMTGRRHISPR